MIENDLVEKTDLVKMVDHFKWLPEIKKEYAWYFKTKRTGII